MKIQYKVNDSCTIEVEGDTQKDVFKELASSVEIFGQISECGKCQSVAVPRVRIVEDNAYHEAACTNIKCRCVLAFGQAKKGGGLFPKRKDNDGKYLENNGWVAWDGKKS